jgi:hypothetical protein
VVLVADRGGGVRARDGWRPQLAVVAVLVGGGRGAVVADLVVAELAVVAVVVREAAVPSSLRDLVVAEFVLAGRGAQLAAVVVAVVALVAELAELAELAAVLVVLVVVVAEHRRHQRS